ncbi:hypothetical protein SAMN04488121_104295 [Chitinophaga filiformis]|uniref:Uncharacterized protein n=1 Tax=Chitinophaga filiformis TaxID=104663 RepID=A0A1G7UAR4_CHIFI|nr:hypothetical protein SAMN04488121_104295 [Chitinophaga filiformis]
MAIVKDNILMQLVLGGPSISISSSTNGMGRLVSNLIPIFGILQAGCVISCNVYS